LNCDATYRWDKSLTAVYRRIVSPGRVFTNETISKGHDNNSSQSFIGRQRMQRRGG
jgi:hypothetical protein